MRAKSFTGMACSIAGALEQIGDRWTLLVLRDLTLGLSRFDDIQESTGVPPQTLAARLRQLEATDIVAKQAYQEHPVRYDYRLTEKGRDLVFVMTALREWGDRWQLHGVNAPPLEVRDRSTGDPVTLALVNSKNGQIVTPDRLRAQPGLGADSAMLTRLGRASQLRGTS